MRFSAANYEKAFPRQNKAASAPAPAHGNVIEEAENVGKKKDPEPDHGNVIEEAPDEIPEEGAAGGADDSE